MVRNRCKGAPTGGAFLLGIGSARFAVEASQPTSRFPSPLAAPPTSVQILRNHPADWSAVWGVLEPVFRGGETFPHDPMIREDAARKRWVEQNQAVMAALDGAWPPAGLAIPAIRAEASS